eukprot:365122-Chlamydomonas_euryale.AAC.2
MIVCRNQTRHAWRPNLMQALAVAGPSVDALRREAAALQAGTVAAPSFSKGDYCIPRHLADASHSQRLVPAASRLVRPGMASRGNTACVSVPIWQAPSLVVTSRPATPQSAPISGYHLELPDASASYPESWDPGPHIVYGSMPPSGVPMSAPPERFVAGANGSAHGSQANSGSDLLLSGDLIGSSSFMEVESMLLNTPPGSAKDAADGHTSAAAPSVAHSAHNDDWPSADSLTPINDLLMHDESMAGGQSLRYRGRHRMHEQATCGHVRRCAASP